MALQKNFDFKIDTLIESSGKLINSSTQAFSNCYIKITNLTGDKNQLKIETTTFDKKNGNILDIKNYSFTPSIIDTSKNFIKQGYEHLKTLNEYKDAVDLLDEGQTA